MNVSLTDRDRALLRRAVRIMESVPMHGEAMTQPVTAGRYCKAKLMQEDPAREHFGVMLLDTQHRVIDFAILFRGTLDGAEVHPREVVRYALMKDAAGVILCHNHPSGNREPSAADRAVTARLKQALALVDVRLLDHFVIADGEPVSLAARGWV